MMKLVIIEPLGVEKEKLLGLAGKKLGEKVEIVYSRFFQSALSKRGSGKLS